MNDFRKLEVWQLSKELSLQIYKVTEMFPESEKFNLTSQIRKSSISIPSNIAEGSGRISKIDFNRFVSIALGSSYELDTQFEIAFELNLISEMNYNELNTKLISINKMLYNLSNYLQFHK